MELETATRPAAGASPEPGSVGERVVVLLGDSIIDNAAYTHGRAAVVDHLRVLAGPANGVALRAQDGARMAHVREQLLALPAATTHLVVSAGGNDVLGVLGVLAERARTVGDALGRMRAVVEAFDRAYAQLAFKVAGRGLPTVLCTIYNPRFADRRTQDASVAALGMFNDCIARHARRRGFALLDLREVCDEDGDFEAQIEPSGRGGRKIAQAIHAVLTRHDFAGPPASYP